MYPLLLPHSDEGEKKTLTSTPLPFNSKKKRRKKIKVHPFPPRTMNKI
jgi:hypothetical protein